jgi:hypothetical protein
MADTEWTNDMFESDLTEDQKALRDVFVNEYMKDFDAYQATLRCGFQPAFALTWAKTLMGESYVQRQIAFLTRKPTADQAIRDIEDRALCENTLREAMQKGPYQGRVAAARAFAALKGWEKPKEGEDSSEQDLVDVFKDIAQRVPV